MGELLERVNYIREGEMLVYICPPCDWPGGGREILYLGRNNSTDIDNSISESMEVMI